MYSKTPSVRSFGQLPDGRSVEAWTLCGAAGLTVEILTYGGIVWKLMLPSKNGDVDVVLGLPNLESYLAGHPYFGAVVGRVASRITGASFDLDGVTYALPTNEPPNHLHGGYRGFDKQLWSATPVTRSDAASSLSDFRGYLLTVFVTVNG